MDELEDVFHAEGDIIDEDDGGVGGVVFWDQGEWAEGLVAEEGERLDAIDVTAGFGVDVVRSEMVGYVQGGELGGEGVEDLIRAVVGAAFDEGEDTVGWTGEANCFDDTAKETG